MHTDFNRACGIAGIHDPKVKEQLLEEADANTQRAKIIELSDTGFSGKSVAG
jgi:Zn-dependent membrane protease YugP